MRSLPECTNCPQASCTSITRYAVPHSLQTAPAANAEGPRKVILEFHIRADETVHVYRAWADEILYCGTSDSLNIR